MRVRTLSTRKDMTFGQSAQNFLVNSPEAVAQIVETTLKLWLGEWYLNLNDGTPYPQGVLGYNSKATADQTIIAQITGIEWVKGLTDFQSVINPNSRRYSVIKGVIFTPFGTTKFELTDLGNF